MQKIYLYSLFITCVTITSCSISRNFSTRFYKQHSLELQHLVNDYQKINTQKPFSVAFRDKRFNEIEFTFNTDSVRYVYNFDLRYNAFTDSLIRYQYKLADMFSLINKMKLLKCTWLTMQDYYEYMQKKSIILLTIRNKALDQYLKNEKYCTYAFFNEPQDFDTRGRLLDKDGKSQNREISGNLFFKITPKVASTIATKYR